MKKTKLPRKLPFKILMVFVAIIVSFALFPIFNSKANSLTAIYVYLTRMATNINGSSANVEITMAIDPNQNMSSGGTIAVRFPDADD